LVRVRTNFRSARGHREAVAPVGTLYAHKNWFGYELIPRRER